MSFIKNYFKQKKPSANIAKERLEIIVSHQRKKRKNTSNNYTQQLERKLVAVIKDHLNIEEGINIHVVEKPHYSSVKLTVELPLN